MAGTDEDKRIWQRRSGLMRACQTLNSRRIAARRNAMGQGFSLDCSDDFSGAAYKTTQRPNRRWLALEERGFKAQTGVPFTPRTQSESAELVSLDTNGSIDEGL